MPGDGSYAPKSPDLSSFYSAGPTPPAEPAEPQQFLSTQAQPNFSHLQQSPPSTYFPSSRPQQPCASQQSEQYQLSTPPQTAFPGQAHHTNNFQPDQSRGYSVGLGYPPPTAQREYYPSRASSYPVSGNAQPGTGYTGTQAFPPQHQQPTFQQQQQHYRSNFEYQHQQPPHHFPGRVPDFSAARKDIRDYYSPPATSAAPPPGAPEAPPLRPGPQGGGSQTHPQPAQSQPTDTAMPPRRAAAAAAAAAVSAQTASESDSAGPSTTSTTITATAAIEPGPVKTKFPTARIKRIMQADEEVGKVAQQTPIAVGKALELFMVALVTKSAEVARQRNSKRVSAQMLKQVVESDDQWDFLRDIVGKVEGEKEKESGGKGAGKGTKVESDVSEGEEGAAGEGAVKKKRGGGRRKKVQ
ncbi:hypothetical protein VTI74DRAFT_3543 [Chaetomium olivicolor]